MKMHTKVTLYVVHIFLCPSNLAFECLYPNIRPSCLCPQCPNRLHPLHSSCLCPLLLNCLHILRPSRPCPLCPSHVCLLRQHLTSYPCLPVRLQFFPFELIPHQYRAQSQPYKKCCCCIFVLPIYSIEHHQSIHLFFFMPSHPKLTITRLLFALAKKVTVVTGITTVTFLASANESLVMSTPSHSGLF